jgi:hypothetical protein
MQPARGMAGAASVPGHSGRDATAACMAGEWPGSCVLAGQTGPQTPSARGGHGEGTYSMFIGIGTIVVIIIIVLVVLALRR